MTIHWLRVRTSLFTYQAVFDSLYNNLSSCKSCPVKMDPSEDSPPTRSTFPQNPEEFDGDPRVSFSKVTNKFILETDDEQEYEFDDALKRWVPVVRPHSPTTAEGLQTLRPCV